MNKQTKQVYQAPTITVVEMKVERGFQGTFNARNNAEGATIHDGTETYDAGNASGWF